MKKRRKVKIRAYYWNPNGTNDIELLNEFGEVIEGIPEAAFGIPMKGQSKIITLETVLKHIAVSPVSDGSQTLKVLSKHFGAVMGGVYE